MDGTLRGQAPELVGPESLDFEQVAATLSATLGRAIQYQPVSVPRYLLHLRRQGDSWGQAVVQTALYVGLRFGQGLGDGLLIRGWARRFPTGSNQSQCRLAPAPLRLACETCSPGNDSLRYRNPHASRMDCHC